MTEPTVYFPRATYRMQFHGEFTFRDATRLVPYLAELGVSHLYASPIFRSTTGSTHGYDVVDYNHFDPEAGTTEEFYALSNALRAQGMSILLDFVPNHMGISGLQNPWWADVLEHGRESKYAGFFDIDWKPFQQGARKQVLLPILGDPYGKVLEGGELRLAWNEGKLTVMYGETRLPLSPGSVRGALEGAKGKAAMEKRLVWLMADANRLDALLSEQNYRLCHWKVAMEEINYRRFFDVNGLAALRVEEPEVFAASHRLLLDLFRREAISGVRIDHIDGLAYPQRYLARLREAIGEVTGRQDPAWVVVEKILGPVEELPAEWAMDGTTGYEFVSEVTGLLVDAGAEKVITRGMANLTGRREDFSEEIYEGKRLVMRMTMASELNALGDLLNEIAESHWWTRDFTLHALTEALREVIACFPVYRSYLDPEEPVREADRRVILRAIALARRRNAGLDRALFSFIYEMLLPAEPPEVVTHPVDEDLRRRFVVKFQQSTGPIMAKGVEDTAFYRYNRFVALNEVGSEPGRWGLSVEEFHRRNVLRQENFSRSLVATSTHDTKRSEDVRARLTVLSEMPIGWIRSLEAWVKWNARQRVAVGEEWAPDANEQCLLYQVLVGSWPLEEMGEAELGEYIGRLQEYMVKALHEAKVNSSWVDPSAEWDGAVREFVERILTPGRGNRFLPDLVKTVERIAWSGAVKSLAQTVLKLTVPGVPDLYQGNEVWDWSLVDPDNRRAVDYARRGELLAGLKGGADVGELVENWRDGRVKMFVIRTLLALRQREPDVFLNGVYEAVEISGQGAEGLVAFTRKAGSKTLLVVVPRLTLKWEWEDCALEGIEEGEWRDVFSEEVRSVEELGGLLERFPVAVLLRDERTSGSE